MADQLIINVGTSPNDGLGDPIHTAFIKTNTNFAQLFATAGITGLGNGSTTLSIPVANGNMTISVGGTSNVAVFTQTGANIGNLTVDNSATVDTLSVTGTVVNDADYVGVNISATGNIDGANLNIVSRIAASTLSLSGNVTSPFNVTGNIAGGNISTPGRISAGGNILSSAGVSATGNVTGAFIIGDGGFLSNVTAVSNVAVTQIANGTTSLAVTGSGGNIAMAVGGIANVVLVTASGANVIGAMNVTGNINGANVNATTGVYASTGYFTGNVDILGNLNATFGTISANGAQIYGNDITGNDSLYAGLLTFTLLGSNVVTQFSANVNSYSQINFQNINNGTSASTDLILTANNGDDSNYYADLGIGSNNYAFSGFESYGPNDTYL